MKYKAVILTTIEIHPVNEKGECTGEIVSSEELKKYDLKRDQIKVIEGFDKHDCILKTKNWFFENN